MIGFAGAWLAFAVLMGLFGEERSPATDERWFRPVGALALAVVVGFVALVGWSKAQSEGGARQASTSEATGNPVLVGRQQSSWSWDASWMDSLGELPFSLGGQPLPGIEGEFTPIDTETARSVIVPTTPPPTDRPESCEDMPAASNDNSGVNLSAIFNCDTPTEVTQ